MGQHYVEYTDGQRFGEVFTKKGVRISPEFS